MKQGFDKGEDWFEALQSRDSMKAWFDNAISHADWVWEVIELQTFEFQTADVLL